MSLLEAEAIKVLAVALFYFGLALIPPLVMLPCVLRDRRIGPLIITGILVAGGLAIETFFLYHYLAPATAILYVLLLQCMRHLRVRGPSGLFLVRATPALCIVLAVLRIFAGPLHFNIAPGRSVTNMASWQGTAPVGLERAGIQSELGNLPGPQLAIVAYAPQHILNDWVYNSADIDKSKVIWARQMDPASDRELLNYYKGRQAWLVEPDCNPPRVSPFPAAQEPRGLTQLLIPLPPQERK